MPVNSTSWSIRAAGAAGRGCAIAGPGDQRSPFHCMIVVEGERCTEAAIAAALAQIGDVCLRVTVTVVADPICPLVLCGPMSGMAAVTICPEELRHQAVARATTAARDAIQVVPVHIPVQHRVASTWREALGMADGCDLLVVAAAPSRRRDRWRLGRRDARIRGLGIAPSPAVLAQ